MTTPKLSHSSLCGEAEDSEVSDLSLLLQLSDDIESLSLSGPRLSACSSSSTFSAAVASNGLQFQPMSIASQSASIACGTISSSLGESIPTCCRNACH
uniref:Uncharacterized protein n=1 Tax=Arundo donax TaxID=35708 RepID=A0A0A9EQI1_ARUDO